MAPKKCAVVHKKYHFYYLDARGQRTLNKGCPLCSRKWNVGLRQWRAEGGGNGNG